METLMYVADITGMAGKRFGSARVRRETRWETISSTFPGVPKRQEKTRSEKRNEASRPRSSIRARRKRMHPAQLEVIARALLQASNVPSSQRPLRRLLTQLLALGQPVAPTQLARAMHSSVEEIRAWLQEIPELEYDEQGNIVGKGLTLLPTAHQFQVNHHPLFTWCAWDALYFPVLLKSSARIISRCPVTAETIRFTVTPEQIGSLSPQAAMTSLVISDATACSTNVRETFCDYSHFFSSPQAAAIWQQGHPDALLLEVQEAYQVAKSVVQAHYSQDAEAGD